MPTRVFQSASASLWAKPVSSGSMLSRRVLEEHEHTRNRDEHHSDHLVECLVMQPRCRCRSCPCPCQTSGQERGDDRPLRGDVAESDGACAKRQCCRHHHEACRLVEDDGFKGRGKRNRPMRSGNRNSAPPSPISPPSVPMTRPATNARRLRCGLILLGFCFRTPPSLHENCGRCSTSGLILTPKKRLNGCSRDLAGNRALSRP